MTPEKGLPRKTVQWPVTQVGVKLMLDGPVKILNHMMNGDPVMLATRHIHRLSQLNVQGPLDRDSRIKWYAIDET
jgi:hypothetical protein